MPLRLSDGTPVSDKLVLAMQKCIDATFDASDWTELGHATGTYDIISSTPRLFRSLDWGDPDYGQRTFQALRRMIAEPAPPILDDVVKFLDLPEWLKANEQSLYNELYSGATPELDQITEDTLVRTVPELLRHARRLITGCASDPEQAIGSAKELLETVMKTVLGDSDCTDNIPKLVKRTREALGLSHFDDSTKRMVSNLSQVVVGVAEMRNEKGTGHGRSGSLEPDATHARLAVDSAVAVSRFFLGLHGSK